MQEHISEQELRDRLTLIESMIAEGRRSAESWGWMFVLWGIAYYLAFAWSRWNAWSWPATMSLAIIVSIISASAKARNHPATTLSRAVGSVWIGPCISMFLLFLALGLSGRLSDQHLFMAVMSAMLGMAYGASALILRWGVQLACAVVWWMVAVATCFGSDAQSRVAFLAAVFLCLIAFGIYGIVLDARSHKPYSPVHA